MEEVKDGRSYGEPGAVSAGRNVSLQWPGPHGLPRCKQRSSPRWSWGLGPSSVLPEHALRPWGWFRPVSVLPLVTQDHPRLPASGVTGDLTLLEFFSPRRISESRIGLSRDGCPSSAVVGAWLSGRPRGLQVCLFILPRSSDDPSSTIDWNSEQDSNLHL